MRRVDRFAFLGLEHRGHQFQELVEHEGRRSTKCAAQGSVVSICYNHLPGSPRIGEIA
jgi:hypothetical protein